MTTARAIGGFHFLATALLCWGIANVALAQKELGVESSIYVGTYTGETSQTKGIYQFRMRTSDDPNSPEFVTVTPLGLAAATDNPSFLEIDAKRRLLFCVNEVENFEGRKAGAVSAFSIDAASGKLTLLNQRSSMGAGPSHLALDRTGNYLLVANKADGSVAVLPLGPEGKLGEATDVKQHSGKSVHPNRQTGPHPTSVTLSPDNRFAFVCDLGLDKILAYRFDADAGRLTPHDRTFTPTKAGAGPRHLAF